MRVGIPVPHTSTGRCTDKPTGQRQAGGNRPTNVLPSPTTFVFFLSVLLSSGCPLRYDTMPVFSNFVFRLIEVLVRV